MNKHNEDAVSTQNQFLPYFINFQLFWLAHFGRKRNAKLKSNHFRRLLLKALKYSTAWNL